MGKREESGACVQYSKSLETCASQRYTSYLIQCADRELAYSGCLRTTDKKESRALVAVAIGKLNYHRHTPEGARDYKLLQKKLANFKIGN